MKARMLLAAGIVASMAGCSSVSFKPVSIPVIPPAQLAQDICPIVKADLELLQGPSGKTLLTAAQQETITNSVVPVNNAVCSAGATVDLSNLQALNATAFPALIAIVAAVPAIPDQPAVLLALQLAQPIVQQVVTEAIAASAASAPVAASAVAK